MKTVADQIIAFNSSLRLTAALPEGIRAMNPFVENPSALQASSLFYKKYYADTLPRHMILGINPGRHGAGLTGVPFTDPKRLQDVCDIQCFSGPLAHEPSSVFIYEMIEQYGGAEAFYHAFYINSICPLGFVARGKGGAEVNYNYYDNAALAKAVYPFAVESLHRQLAFGIDRAVCFCLGTGKNMQFLSRLNEREKIFERIVPLEHPRYIMQYRNKTRQTYSEKYVELLRAV